MSRLVQQATQGRCGMGISEDGEVHACDDLAPYYVEGSGYGPMGTTCCAHHTYEALQYGGGEIAVTGPQGGECRIDDDLAEIVETWR